MRAAGLPPRINALRDSFRERGRSGAMNIDLISLGEMLIDFTPVGVSEQGNPIFERNPGGGPANLACAAAKLGAGVSLLTKVGDDVFGRALRDTLLHNGVDASHMVFSQEHPTSLAFVHLDEKGDRSFSFYRKGGADTTLRAEEIPESALKEGRYFFLSSVMMSEGTSRETSFILLDRAKALGKTIVFDPNLRLNLWDSPEEARSCILNALAKADLVKLSEEELGFLEEDRQGRELDVERSAASLMERFPSIQLLLATLGPKGCYARTREYAFFDQGFPGVKTVDTTAAGDSFTGGFLSRLAASSKPAAEFTQKEMEQAVRFANAVGSLTTTKKGSISALPSLEEVQGLLERGI